MKNIRQSVFETNSSSSHSITISKDTDGIYESISPDKDGRITLTGGDFGWEWCRYNNALVKANYCAVYSKNNLKDTQMLIDVLKEHTGASDIVFDIKDSYIDHQSSDVASSAFKDKDSLKEFIFNTDSWLFTGNDGDASPPNFYDVERNIKYKYEFSIEKIKDKAFFRRKPSRHELSYVLDSMCRRKFKDYEYIPYLTKFIGLNKRMSTFSKFKEDIIILFKTKDVYDKNKFVGYKIISTKELKFSLKRI